MNDKIKILLGAVVGAGVGYFIAAVIVEVVAQRKALSLLPPSENEKVQALEKEEPSPNVLQRSKKPLGKNVVKNYSQYFKSVDRPDLAQLAAKYNGETETEEEETELGDAKEEEPKDWYEDDFNEIIDETDDPSVITMDEYAGDEMHTHVTLHYYDDDVVTDAKGNPIDRPEQLLGEDALVSFGEQSGDPDIVYVRNTAKKAMYEVLRKNEDFSAPAKVKRTAAPRRPKEEENEEAVNS